MSRVRLAGLPTTMLLAAGWLVCWSLILLDDDLLATAGSALGLGGIAFAVILGATTALWRSALATLSVATGLVFVPRPVDPEAVAREASGGCDPFCDTGGPLVDYGVFYLALLAPLVVSPVLAGALVRAVRDAVAARRADDVRVP